MITEEKLKDSESLTDTAIAQSWGWKTGYKPEDIAALLVEVRALRKVAEAAPFNINCEIFHHKKKDQHGLLEECPPLGRYAKALSEWKAGGSK